MKKSKLNVEKSVSQIFDKHVDIQKEIFKAVGEKTNRVKEYIKYNHRDLNNICQRDLNYLGELTLLTENAEIYDHCKNKVFTTLGMCVGKHL